MIYITKPADLEKYDMYNSSSGSAIYYFPHTTFIMCNLNISDYYSITQEFGKKLYKAHDVIIKSNGELPKINTVHRKRILKFKKKLDNILNTKYVCRQCGKFLTYYGLEKHKNYKTHYEHYWCEGLLPVVKLTKTPKIIYHIIKGHGDKCYKEWVWLDDDKPKRKLIKTDLTRKTYYKYLNILKGE